MDEEFIGKVDNSLLYDLRAIYAVEIVGEHLKDIAKARKANDFPAYYENLNDLLIITAHKFDSKKVKVKTKDKDGKEKEEEINALTFLNTMMNKIGVLSGKYQGVWTGQGGKNEERQEIKNALNSVEMFLYKQMEISGLFGSNRKTPGL